MELEERRLPGGGKEKKKKLRSMLLEVTRRVGPFFVDSQNRDKQRNECEEIS